MTYERPGAVPRYITYDYADIVEAIQEHAERHHGIKNGKVRYYYNMDDRLCHSIEEILDA